MSSQNLQEVKQGSFNDLKSNVEGSQEGAKVPTVAAQEIPKASPTFPDGGLRAWTTILGCFLLSFTSYGEQLAHHLIIHHLTRSVGQLNAFGVFQTYYAEHQLSGRSDSDISWIGSLQLGLIYAGGLVLGRMFDAYGSRVIPLPFSMIN